MKRQQKNIVGAILSICFALLYACDANTLDSGLDCPDNLDDVFVCGTFPTEMQGEWGGLVSRGSAWDTTRSVKDMETDSTSIYLRGPFTTAFPAYGTYINAGVDSENRTLGNVMTDRSSAMFAGGSVASSTLGDISGTAKYIFIPSSDVRFGIVGDVNNLKVMILSGYVDTYDTNSVFVETISVGGTFWEFTLMGETTNVYQYHVKLGSLAWSGGIGNNQQIVKWK